MNRYFVGEYSWTMLNIVERFLYVPPAFVFIWRGMTILHTLDDDWWLVVSLVFFSLICACSHISYVLNNIHKILYIHTHAHLFFLCDYLFQYLPPWLVTSYNILFSRFSKNVSVTACGDLRTNLLDIFFDQVRVRRSQPLTSSAIFCESAEVARMDESTENAKKRSLVEDFIAFENGLVVFWCFFGGMWFK